MLSVRNQNRILISRILMNKLRLRIIPVFVLRITKIITKILFKMKFKKKKRPRKVMLIFQQY